MIPIFRPKTVPLEDSFAKLEQIRSSGIYSNYGAQVELLERTIAAFLNVEPKQVVAVSSATSGLHGALAISDVSQWMMPSFTFPATGLAAIAANKVIQFIDVNSENWMIRLASEPLNAVGQLLVLPFGVGLPSMIWGNSSPVVIDAAASLGELEGKVGSIPDQTAIVVSLHATKVLGVGEGGFVVFGNEETARKFRTWTNFGFLHDRVSTQIGYNGKMSEITAAFLLSEFDRWNEAESEWRESREAADALNERFGLTPQPYTRGIISPYWNIVLDSPGIRERLEVTLNENGVSTRRWWKGLLHTAAPFRNAAAPPLPESEALASKVLGLPFYRGLDFDALGQRLEKSLDSL